MIVNLHHPVGGVEWDIGSGVAGRRVPKRAHRFNLALFTGSIVDLSFSEALIHN